MENSNYNILIVDDDKDDHLFLRTALREVMPRALVKSVYDGADALEYLNVCTTLPHVVFMDLNMTRTSGKTATTLIRNDKRLSEMPVIILSTSTGSHEKNELLELGASDFYTKPCSISELVKIVQNVKNTWLNSISANA